MCEEKRIEALQEKEKFFQKQLKENPDDIAVQISLGNVILQIEQLRKNIKIFKKIYKKSKSAEDAHRVMCMKMLEESNAREALHHARKAYKLNPSFPQNRKNFFECLVICNPADIDDGLYEEVLDLLRDKTVCAQPVYITVLAILKHRYNNEKDYLNDPLFLLCLKRAVNISPEIEFFLTEKRKEMLFDTEKVNLPFCCALAIQCFNNEYIFSVTEEEENRLKKLLDKSEKTENEMALTACYVPLSEAIDSNSIETKELVKEQVKNREKEEELKKHIPVIGKIKDRVSLKVKEQYEKAPYPRWKEVTFWNEIKSTEKLKVLIAGCGSGQHAIDAALRYPNSKITAVDLSLSALAYAKRKSDEIGIKNISYINADILELNSFDEKFEVIESIGVLHHMEKPVAGLEILKNLMTENGIMEIGLYSSLARQTIYKVRKELGIEKPEISDSDIKKYRKEIFARADDFSFSQVIQTLDFYSVSTCRDMLFHVQETCLSIEEIEELINETGLFFCGFKNLSFETLKKYRQKFPKDRENLSFKNWSNFEKENPYTFTNLYRFEVSKKKKVTKSAFLKILGILSFNNYK